MTKVSISQLRTELFGIKREIDLLEKIAHSGQLDKTVQEETEKLISAKLTRLNALEYCIRDCEEEEVFEVDTLYREGKKREHQNAQNMEQAVSEINRGLKVLLEVFENGGR